MIVVIINIIFVNVINLEKAFERAFQFEDGGHSSSLYQGLNSFTGLKQR